MSAVVWFFRRFVLILVWCVLFCFVLASQVLARPDLPTAFYGKVLYDDGTDAVGIVVTAYFFDDSGVEFSVSTKTQGARPDGSQGGYYYFTDGFVQAASGTSIILDVSGVTRDFPASPGRSPFVMDSVIIPKRSSQVKDVRPLAKRIVPTGRSRETGPSDMPSGTYVQDRMSFQEVEALLNDPYIASQSFRYGNYTIYADKRMQRYLRFFNQTIIYGKVTDESGQGVGDVNITIVWQDADGNHAANTSTISRSKAKMIGNSSLEGLYVFHVNSTAAIGVDENFSGVINFSVGNASLPSVPYIFGPSHGGVEDVVTRRQESGEVPLVEELFSKREGSVVVQLVWLVVMIVFVFIFVVIVVFGRRWMKGTVNEVKRKLAFSSLMQDTSRVKKEPVSSLMRKDVVTTSPDLPVEKMMQEFLNRNIGCLVVSDGVSVRGIVTERDILKTVLKRGSVSGLKVGDCMTLKVTTIRPDEDTHHAVDVFLKEDIRKLPVVVQGRLVGIITQSDILEHLYGYVERNRISGLPMVKGYMTKRFVLMDKSALVGVGVERMLENDATAVLVVDGKMELLGILTEKDVLSELAINPFFLKSTPVAAIMKTRLVTCIQGTGVHEANRLMQKNNVRRLPIVVGGTVVGIIDQEDILHAYADFLALVNRKNVEVLD